MQNIWVHDQIRQLERGIRFMETGQCGAPCDLIPGQSPSEREAAEAGATAAAIAKDRATILELRALIPHA